jgi:hypothetical protein
VKKGEHGDIMVLVNNVRGKVYDLRERWNSVSVQSDAERSVLLIGDLTGKKGRVKQGDRRRGRGARR